MSQSTTNDAALRQSSMVENSETSCASIDSRVNRRSFLAAMGMGGAALALSPLDFRPVMRHGSAKEMLLCVGSFGASDAGTLHLLHIQRDGVHMSYTHPSERPAAIVRHPSRSLLYVANDVSLYQHQPRGSVETFALNPATGTLELVGRQPLSLSATRPRSLAISPDGRSLLVAAFGGGAYNVLPIDESGLPAAPSAILKQVGQGAHATEQASAHPAHVMFHPRTEIAIAADYGADRLDILVSDHGESGARKMKVASRIPCAVGSGPSKIAMHPDGELFVVAHRLHPTIAAFRFDRQMKLIPIGHVSLNDTPAAICFHSQKRILFAAQSRETRQALLTTWVVDSQKQTLQQFAEVPLPAGTVASMHTLGCTLWLASDRGIIAAELDPNTGTPHKTYRVSSTPDLQSMVLL